VIEKGERKMSEWIDCGHGQLVPRYDADDEVGVDITTTEWYKKQQEKHRKQPIRWWWVKTKHAIIGNLFWRPYNYIKNKGYKDEI
jgi:hypothetical protein